MGNAMFTFKVRVTRPGLWLI